MSTSKIRVTRLNEGQLSALVAIEADRASHGHTSVVPRDLRGIAQLTKRHNVRVAEADDKVAGYVAWRDESPGVGYIEDFVVPSDFQSTEVGETLLASVRDEARALKLPVLLVRSPSAAPWAPAFYAKAGFAPLGPDAPEAALSWQREQTAGGKPLADEGVAVLWAKV